LFKGLYSPPHPSLMFVGALRRTAVEVHNLQRSDYAIRQSTVALADVQCPDGSREVWASGSGMSLSNLQIAKLGEFKTRILHGYNHAEMNIIGNLAAGATVVRWGISWGGTQRPDPCPECRPHVTRGNPTIER
jgi:hypothetical protein